MPAGVSVGRSLARLGSPLATLRSPSIPLLPMASALPCSAVISPEPGSRVVPAATLRCSAKRNGGPTQHAAVPFMTRSSGPGCQGEPPSVSALEAEIAALRMEIRCGRASATAPQYGVGRRLIAENRGWQGARPIALVAHGRKMGKVAASRRAGMGQNSKIEWTTHTFNPWWGCTKVSRGLQALLCRGLGEAVGQAVWGPGADRRTFGEAHWREPLNGTAQRWAPSTGRACSAPPWQTSSRIVPT